VKRSVIRWLRENKAICSAWLGALAAVFTVEIVEGKVVILRIIANPNKLTARLSHSGGVTGSF
jgi:hypothetical protein